MICTDTDNYVNVNYKERNKKPCSFKVAYLFHRTSCSNFFFFEKHNVKCTHALAAVPFFHSECVNLTISPSESVTTESLDIFFKKIKKWIPWECSCRLRKTYVPQVGFI